MRLFEMKDWNLHISEQAWGLSPFKKLLDKDTSSDKSRAIKEITFIWFYSDIKSDYQYILNPKDREKEIKKDLKLPSAWKITKDIQIAIDFYNERSTTTASKLLKDSLYIADKVSSLMKNTVDDDDLTITQLNKLTTTLQQMPKIVLALQETEKAVLKDIAVKQDKVGSQQKGLFEDGLQFDE